MCWCKYKCCFVIFVWREENYFMALICHYDIINEMVLVFLLFF